ncbi:uncharacterized protein LOC110060823 [Orbicella faveolata]|uniref:uncharacterized protein LOC110060823 n=1 Tax=Orbicella faveolata TaxID=48498 RepID=UPI0009E3B0D6|nr:uncharacterized protein LOC110060823 [Orbicella faveolata]
MCAYWICFCSYGIYHCVAAAQPLVEEVTFLAEFRADRFDHPELQQLAKTRPVSSVNSAVYGVSWVHKKSGYQEPSKYPVVKQVVDAARRILARPAERKEPLSSVLVRKVIGRLEKGNLGDLQRAALFSLGFFGFLRWDDLRHFSVDSFYFADSHVAIFLEKRKNDQFREGLSVISTRVAYQERSSSAERGCMSYSRAKELIKEELGKEGQDPTKFGIHSLCSGGTSAAAALGVPDRLFQRHGGRRSERARNNYVKESLDSLLLVTKSI